jgi:hypothetical protein
MTPPKKLRCVASGLRSYAQVVADQHRCGPASPLDSSSHAYPALLIERAPNVI